MEDPIEGADSSTGEVAEVITEIIPEGETPEQKAERLEGINKQLYARAKKAEGFELVEGNWVKKSKPAAPATAAPAPSQEPTFTPKDTLALIEAKVSSEDFDEVVRVSKILGKPIAEALKDKTLKSILTERVEERRTANATHTGGGRRTSTVSGADLLEAARAGQDVPLDRVDDLAEARMASKKGK